jgi:hypothetical protein
MHGLSQFIAGLLVNTADMNENLMTKKNGDLKLNV